MDKLIIYGGQKLKGTIKASRAKNATLPIMAATLLTSKPVRIRNVPQVQDVKTMAELLKSLGAEVNFDGDDVIIESQNDLLLEAPFDIVRKMRASYYVLGPLLARYRKAKVYLPGGCAIGPRPIDLHIKGMEALGARIEIRHGYIEAEAKVLKGQEILLEGKAGPSVGATANVMMAATLAKGTTKIIGAALEPEIVDLANFLNSLGAKISGQGTSTITIEGVKELNGGEWTPIPDRIEVGTYLCAAIATYGEISIEQCEPKHLDAVLFIFNQLGCEVSVDQKVIRLKAPYRPKAISIVTAPYPGFPTDLQAQIMAVLATASGVSYVTENIFKARFLHALELNRMGADIKIEDNVAIINGVKRLSGAKVMASDLRASAALVIAGLGAEGVTEISRIYHLDRGYEALEKKLTALGAKLERIKT
ncbi:MAG: UDP-N-acetylglucosamine 1-carboxyvinyltransferase [candidate division WOR-3 bacterium]|nr:UDP-N-acetylglucosamine 1-carboxyvinyltransferase [candidate division WOR-3 bacterium]MCX7757487.1 UDP-N-acetylglucosamine 1-carboxyvinyltransferase [candidate division WOR-3 bacterium]MDW7987134.1 UDP-N-acetylglucosamine 1-carboxyvinyltransferase [candidate division WOR-3 bacterium]